MRPAAALPWLSGLVLLVAAALSGCGGDDPATRGEGGRVLVLGLDGVDPDVVETLVGEGKLPNLARLAREGASGRLHSPQPLLSPVIWTTVATGRTPSDHGIGHFTTVDPRSGRELPVTSRMRRVPALWNLLSDSGRKVAVVGWWATWPAEPVHGVIVSDHAGYHFLMAEEVGDRDQVVSPPEETALLDEFMISGLDLAPEDLARFVDLDSSDEPAAERPDDAGRATPAFAEDLDHLRWALATARSYSSLGLELWNRDDPDLLMVYIEGVDTASHLFGHLHRQPRLAGELAAQQRRFGRTVEEMYGLADEIVGMYLAELDDETTLVVLSDHGFRLGELPTDPSSTRDLRRVSEAYHEEEGILYLYGRGVRGGAELQSPHILDLTPTILALTGSPAAEDMPGRVLEEGLRGISEPPRVSTYRLHDSESPASDEGAQTSAVDAAILDKLESLGYLGSSSTSNDRNLASILLQEGRYEEAARAFTALVRQDEDDPVNHMSLGVALAGLGELDRAETEMRAALELDPVYVPGYHNLGLLLERRGRHEEAVASYRTALRFDPGYEPTRKALERLEVPAEERVAATPEERRVAQLLRDAVVEVQRGDYKAAEVLVEEALRLAPDEAVVHQYSANVAFLQGDLVAARAALERALELDPTNAQLRRNLERLERRPNP